MRYKFFSYPAQVPIHQSKMVDKNILSKYGTVYD